MSELPIGWGTAVLAQLISSGGILSDGDWVESKDQDPNGAIRLLQLADIGDGIFVDKSNRFINEEQFERLRCTEVLEWDVLIARMPNPLGRACIAPALKQRCVTVVDVAIVRPGPSSVSSKWLMYFLNAPSIRQEIELQSTGTTRRRISRGNLTKLQLPIPPLNEQKRIADELDAVLAKVGACRERLDRVPAILKRLRQSVLAAATSGKLTEEWRKEMAATEDWRTVRLDEIAEVQGGVTKDSKKQSSADEEVPYLRVANVQRGYLDLAEIKTIRVPASKLESLLLEHGDMLFNEGGDIDKLGRGWVWEGQIDRCTFQNHVFRARLFDKSNQPKYISWWGNYRGLNYFLRGGKQTTNLASINKSMLRALPISLPPFDEQAEIVRRVEDIFAYADRLEARYTAARAPVEKLTPALLAKASRGELVPQDPNDEPASALLERIRAARAETQAQTKSRKGAGRTKKTQRTEVNMLNRNDIPDNHLSAILKERGPLNAEALWSASQLDIDDFYDQLKAENTRGLLNEVRGDDPTVLRLLEARA